MSDHNKPNSHEFSAKDEPLDAAIVDEPRDAYNVVSDTVTGVNLRLSDNVFQAILIAVCSAFGAAIGASVVRERIPGAVAGGLAGIIVGLLLSGIILMVYRAARHIRGRHD